MRQFAAQRLLKIEDATSVIGSGDLQTTQEFFKQIGMEAAKQLFQDDKNLQTLMVMAGMAMGMPGISIFEVISQ